MGRVEATAKMERQKARRKPAGSAVIHVNVNAGSNDFSWVMASIVDIIDSGCGLALTTPLEPGSTVLVRAGRNHTGHAFADVRWCIAKSDGTYRAGLRLLGGHSIFFFDDEPFRPEHLDCYALLRLAPDADQTTISRAYRKLALRYHPDNLETGDNEMFLRLSRAYQVLGDPEKRALYDLARTGGSPLRKDLGRNANAARSRSSHSGPATVSVPSPVPEPTYYCGDGRPRNSPSPSAGALRGWNAALQRS